LTYLPLRGQRRNRNFLTGFPFNRRSWRIGGTLKQAAIIEGKVRMSMRKKLFANSVFRPRIVFTVPCPCLWKTDGGFAILISPPSTRMTEPGVFFLWNDFNRLIILKLNMDQLLNQGISKGLITLDADLNVVMQLGKSE
jgi:hypothetical protein